MILHQHISNEPVTGDPLSHVFQKRIRYFRTKLSSTVPERCGTNVTLPEPQDKIGRIADEEVPRLPNEPPRPTARPDIRSSQLLIKKLIREEKDCRAAQLAKRVGGFENKKER